MTILRAMAGIFAGAIALGVVQSFALGVGLGVLRASHGPISTWALLKAAVTVASCGMGGLVCALIARGAERWSITVLALLVGAFVAIQSLLPRMGEPLWFSWALPVISILGVLGGGAIWLRTSRP